MEEEKKKKPPSVEILAYDSTSLGTLCLRRRELLSLPGTIVTEVTLDHEFLMSSFNTVSERALTTEAIKMAGSTVNELKVLVGGLGLGYTAFEALKSSKVVQVDVIEFLPQVITWVQEDLIPLAGELKSDSRLNIIEDDVYKRLTADTCDGAPYDLILIDVDHAPSEQLDHDSHIFYTAAGLEKVRKHLAPNGILAVWSWAEDGPFADALKEVFTEFKMVPVEFTNQLIDEEQKDWLFLAR
jgi:spermidine synthase